MPQIAAGMRRLPPESLPVAIGIMLAASAAAEPPDEPPQITFGSKGFPVGPKTALVVLAPAPNSGVLVLQNTLAPDRRRTATRRSSSSGTNTLKDSRSEGHKH